MKKGLQGAFGGASEKLGNRFEGHWTLHICLKILQEKSTAITLEPLGNESIGIEFRLEVEGKLERHQIKLNEGNWTPKQLKDNGVLEAMSRHTSDGTFVFISNQDSPILRKLTQRVSDCSTAADVPGRAVSQEDWNKFCDEYPGTEQQAHAALQRTRFEQYTQPELQKRIELTSEILFEGDSHSALLHLGDLLEASVHTRLTCADLWSYLEKRSFYSSNWKGQDRIKVQLDHQNQRFLDFISQARALPFFHRAFANDRIPSFKGATDQVIVLVGEGGGGKSEILVDIIGQLPANLPYLAFSVRSLRQVSNPVEIGNSLGLSASPAKCLSKFAGLHAPSLLIIDQLDELGQISGRDSQLWAPIWEVINEARTLKINLLLVCRKHDLHEDINLNSLLKIKNVQEFEVGPLTRQETQLVFLSLGIKEDEWKRLSDEDWKFLAHPFHLHLFAEVGKFMGKFEFDDLNLFALLDRYWDCKKSEIHTHSNEKPTWFWAVLGKTADLLSTEQLRYLPEGHAFAQKNLIALNQLVSAHILLKKQEGFHFAHDLLAESAQVHFLIENDIDLIQFLLREEQLLSKARPLRAYLSFQKDKYPAAYLRNLKTLLEHSGIRYYLKRSAFFFLAHQASILPEEWELLQGFLLNEEHLFHKLAKRLLRWGGWAKFADSEGILENWLKSENELLQAIAMTPLEADPVLAPFRVIELIRALDLSIPENRLKILPIFWGRMLNTESSYFTLMLDLIRTDFPSQNGIFPILNNFEHFSYSLVSDKPEWAAEAISALLDRWLDVIGKVGINDFDAVRLFDSKNQFTDFYEKHALKEPQAFIRYFLPLYYRAVEHFQVEDRENGYYFDRLAELIHDKRYQEPRTRMKQCLVKCCALVFEGLTDSLQLAVEKGERTKNEGVILFWAQVLTKIKGIDDNYKMQFFLRHFVLVKGGEAARFTFRDLLGSAASTTSVSLLDDLFENIRSLKVEKFEPWGELFGHVHDRKSTFKSHYHHIESLKLLLLQVIPDSRMPNDILMMRKVLERKFPRGVDHFHSRSSFGTIGSPLPKANLAEFTDQNWLNAMKRYDTNDRDRGFDDYRGGARELGQAMSEEVKKNPDRFLDLGQGIPLDVHPDYFFWLLSGLRDTTEPFDEKRLWLLLHRIQPIMNHELHRATSRLLKKLVKTTWPNEVFEMAIQIAMASPKPDWERDEEVYYQAHSRANTKTFRFWQWVQTKPNLNRHLAKWNPFLRWKHWEMNYHNVKDDLGVASDLEHEGINSARGGGYELLGAYVAQHPEKLAQVKQVWPQMLEEKSLAVCGQMLGMLMHFQRIDAAWTADALKKLLGKKPVFLLASRSLYEFFCFAPATYYRDLFPIIKKMAGSSLKEAQTNAGILLSFESYNNQKPSKMLRRLLLKGTPCHRLGIAIACTDNAGNPECNWLSRKYLPSLFNDKNEKVREQAANWIFHVKEESFWAWQDTITKFIQSPALTDSYFFLEWLQKEPIQDSAFALEIVKKILEIPKERRKQTGGRGRKECHQILMNLYRQSGDSEIRRYCLDYLDELLKQLQGDPLHESLDDMDKLQKMDGIFYNL